MAGEDIFSWSTTAADNDTADTAINWREGMARAAVNDSMRSVMAAVAKNRDLTTGAITTGGTADAQTFVSGVAYTILPTGLRVLLKIGAGLTNTGAATLNMDSLGAIAIKDAFADDLVAGDLREGSFVEFLYDGTNWVMTYRNSPFPTGTVMLFQQTAAPVGWTKQATHNDKALRVVSGTAASGGSVAFSTVFARTASDAHTLTTAEMPSHQHLLNFYQGPGDSNGGGYLTGNDQFGGYNFAGSASGSTAFTIEFAGSGASHTHPMDIRVQYVDCILASRD